MAGSQSREAEQEKEPWKGRHAAAQADNMVQEQGMGAYHLDGALIQIYYDGFARAYVKNLNFSVVQMMPTEHKSRITQVKFAFVNQLLSSMLITPDHIT